MSYWSNCKGTVATRSSSHMSLSTIIRSVFHEQIRPVAEIVRKTDKMVVYSVDFNFCDHGMNAVRRMEEFSAYIREFDKEAELRLVLSLHWT